LTSYKPKSAVLIILLILNASQKIFRFDADLNPSKIATNGFINPDSSIDILITNIKPFTEVVSYFIRLSDATTLIYENDVKMDSLKTYDILKIEVGLAII
jgi:hypothetical protein